MDATAGKFGKRVWVSRQLHADVAGDVLEASLVDSLKHDAEYQGYTPLEGTAKVEILDPEKDPAVRFELPHDAPDDVLVALVTIQVTKNL